MTAFLSPTVLIFANLRAVPFSIEYFHPRVRAEIDGWPLGILADYARMAELLMEFGPDLRKENEGGAR